MNSIMVGDLVRKNEDGQASEYRIIEIYDVFGGNFHDGYTITRFAKLDDNSSHEFSYTNYMTGFATTFNKIIKISR